MTQFVCSNCNYKFTAFKEPKRCPYCSKEGTAKREATAGDILREVDSMIEQDRI